MNYRNLTENKIENGEILSAEDEKICSLLGGLKRVGAPKDFDFRLKARFANAKPRNDYRTQFLPALRYVLPLSLVLLICAAVVFNSVYFADTQNVSPIAENHSQTPIEDEKQPNNFSSNEPNGVANVIQAPESKELAVSVPTTNIIQVKDKTINRVPEISRLSILPKSVNRQKSEILPKENASEVSGGSHDNALSLPPKLITPPGITLNSTIKTPPNAVNATPLTAKDVLSLLGIEAIFAGGNWKVKSVKQNSAAARSGVRTGDAVEAIDDEKLTDQPLQNKSITGKKLRITRGAEKIEINLSNPQN